MHGMEFNDRTASLAADGAVLSVEVSAGAVPSGVASHGAELWVAVSPPPDVAVLGEALHRLRSAGYVVQGFVDRAAVLAGWLRLAGQVVVLDVTQHQVSISLVVAEAGAVELRRTVSLPGGMQRLHDIWLQLAAQTLVQQTRFDPLHDQRHEAQLRAQLTAVAMQAQREGLGHCVVDAAGTQLALAFTRDQLCAAALDWLQPVAMALQAISAGAGDCAALVAPALEDVPGFADVLRSGHFTAVYRTEDGVAACAASRMPLVSLPQSGAVQYLTRVPVVEVEASEALQKLDLAVPGSQAVATHVVYQGRAIAIPAQGLVIGRDPGDADALRLPEGIAGLSRRHCTLLRTGTRVQLVDHSTHGSFLDGVRVRGRALLSAGSTLRLGTPGIELPLIAL